jgi:hypothetical protein
VHQTAAKQTQRAVHHQSGIAVVGLGNHPPIVEKKGKIIKQTRTNGSRNVPANPLPDKNTPFWLRDTDPQAAFYRKIGYLPPLTPEVSALVEALRADPEMTIISPGDDGFERGLTQRNILIDASPDRDPAISKIANLKSALGHKTPDQQELDLWNCDLAKCWKDNEALFQRTIMIAMIDRGRLFYDKTSAVLDRIDFSVEHVWRCLPMPSRAYRAREQFLTMPKPDLSVCFQREQLIPEKDWQELPTATKQLVCCEGLEGSMGTRAFPFLTIEAKSSFTSTQDQVTLQKNLNNASQELHNMYEFLEEAGGSYEEKFFEQVRFFSAVATTEGVVIHIHRAKKIDENSKYNPIPGANNREDYPLQFEFQQFWPLEADHEADSKPPLDRQTILQQIENIIVGYGANELFPLLQEAAKIVSQKFSKDDRLLEARANQFYYMHGQEPLRSKKRNRRENPPQEQSVESSDTDQIQAGSNPTKKRKISQVN